MRFNFLKLIFNFIKKIFFLINRYTIQCSFSSYIKIVTLSQSVLSLINKFKHRSVKCVIYIYSFNVSAWKFDFPVTISLSYVYNTFHESCPRYCHYDNLNFERSRKSMITVCNSRQFKTNLIRFQLHSIKLIITSNG